MSIREWFRCTFGRDDEVRPGAAIQMVPYPPQAPPIWSSPAPRRPHHSMFIVAAEDIKAGQVIYLDAVADGSYNARLRKVG